MALYVLNLRDSQPSRNGESDMLGWMIVFALHGHTGGCHDSCGGPCGGYCCDEARHRGVWRPLPCLPSDELRSPTRLKNGGRRMKAKPVRTLAFYPADEGPSNDARKSLQRIARVCTVRPDSTKYPPPAAATRSCASKAKLWWWRKRSHRRWKASSVFCSWPDRRRYSSSVRTSRSVRNLKASRLPHHRTNPH